MGDAYLELEYRRREDNRPVTLYAALPKVRAITVGGAPSDLRLPGVPVEATYARIVPAGTDFELQPARSAATPVTFNDQPLAKPHRLEPYDQITVDRYRLTFHEGSLPEEPPLIETPLRWRLSAGQFDVDANPFDETSKPYVEEFELSTRPYVQAERFADVQKAAEDEIQRLIRAPEGDHLESYTEYLWWQRLRMAREADSPQLDEILSQAYDLFPESTLIAVACGVTHMTRSEWQKAADAFERALRAPLRRATFALHDARAGRIVAQHLADADETDVFQRAIPAGRLDSAGWQAPPITLHAPGDEVLFWRMAWHGRVFGRGSDVRFVYRGDLPAGPDAQHEVQRWEVHNLKRGVAWRLILRFPDLPFADPGLALEVSGLRNSLSQQGSFAGLFVDRSNEQVEQRPPVALTPAALARLPKRTGRNQAVCARLSSSNDRVRLEIVRKPAADDLVYPVGSIYVALDETVQRDFGGGTLDTIGRRRFVLRTADDRTTAIRYRGMPFWRRDVYGAAVAALAIALLLFVVWMLAR